MSLGKPESKVCSYLCFAIVESFWPTCARQELENALSIGCLLFRSQNDFNHRLWILFLKYSFPGYSGTHTHSAPGGFIQYTLYQITSMGFSEEAMNAYVEGVAQAILRYGIYAFMWDFID